jgi:putative membrane protein
MIVAFILMRTGRDLYYLVKFLPAYALPAGKPSNVEFTHPNDSIPMDSHMQSLGLQDGSPERDSSHYKRPFSASAPDLLPPPVTSPTNFSTKKTTFLEPNPGSNNHPHSASARGREIRFREKEQVILSPSDEKFLFPAYMPPKYHFFDLFPFSLLVGTLTARGKDVKGKKAAKIRARMRKNAISHNLPHEISLYIVSGQVLIGLSLRVV